MISMRLWDFIQRHWHQRPEGWAPIIGWYHDLTYKGPEWTFPYLGDLPKEAYEIPTDYHRHSVDISSGV